MLWIILMGQKAQAKNYSYPTYGEPGGCVVQDQAIRVELSQNKIPGQSTSNSKLSRVMIHKLFLRTLSNNFPRTALSIYVSDLNISSPTKHLQIPGGVFPLSNLINPQPYSPTVNITW